MCKVIAVAMQKGGCAKTSVSLNLGIGLARAGKKVLLIDNDPQGNLTASLGYEEPDDMSDTLASVMMKIINEEPIEPGYGIIHHQEGIDLIPGNIELSGLEVLLANVMSRENILKEYIDQVKDQYGYIIIDCTVASMGEVMKRIMMADMKEAGMDQETMDAMIQDMPMVEDSVMTVITNVQGINGAAAIFYPDQMDKIAERLGGDYFILPSSVHETLVVPDDGKMSFLELRSMVTEINATMVNPSERLTDEVYHYDSKDKVFEKAATFDARQKAKTKQQEKDVSNKDQSLRNAVKTPKKHKSNDMSL